MDTICKVGWLHIKDRKVLYARSYNKDLFYTPGGKCEADEIHEQALVREIQEELSVDILPETIAHQMTLTAQAHGKPAGVMLENHCFTADFTGTITPENEIEELAWFTTADMHRTSEMGQMILRWLQEHDLID